MNADYENNAPVLYIYNAHNATSLRWKFKIQIRSVSNMNDKYENLANAIILQATKDYRKALRTLSLNPHNCSAQYECRSIEQFFRSDWFGVLTRLDPELLISKLKAEVAA